MLENVSQMFNGAYRRAGKGQRFDTRDKTAAIVAASNLFVLVGLVKLEIGTWFCCIMRLISHADSCWFGCLHAGAQAQT